MRDNGHLKAEQKRLNSAHSSTRVDIERSFGLLKGKLRKLKYLDMHKVEEIPNVIITCCALLNFTLLHESLDEDDIEMQDEGDENENFLDEDDGQNVSLEGKRNHASAGINRITMM